MYIRCVYSSTSKATGQLRKGLVKENCEYFCTTNINSTVLNSNMNRNKFQCLLNLFKNLLSVKSVW